MKRKDINVYIKYLPLTRKRRRKIEDTTYAGYEANVKSVVAPYFAKKKIKLKDLTAKDILVWLGRSDFSTTANIYSHLDAVTKADTGAAMSKALW